MISTLAPPDAVAGITITAREILNCRALAGPKEQHAGTAVRRRAGPGGPARPGCSVVRRRPGIARSRYGTAACRARHRRGADAGRTPDAQRALDRPRRLRLHARRHRV